jgi:hypothetical protein
MPDNLLLVLTGDRTALRVTNMGSSKSSPDYRLTKPPFPEPRMPPINSLHLTPNRGVLTATDIDFQLGTLSGTVPAVLGGYDAGY